MSTNNIDRRSGFSLIELVAALALASMLLVAVGSVLSKLVASLNTFPPEQVSDSFWVDRLRDELSACERYELTDKKLLRITGRFGRDPETRQQMHRRVLVEYRVTEIAGQLWLARRSVDESGSSRFSLVRRSTSSIEVLVADRTESGFQALSHAKGSYPRSIRLRFRSSEGPSTDLSFHLRDDVSSGQGRA